MSADELKQAIQEQFGGSAEAYVSSSVLKGAADLQRMLDLAEPRGDERVLDVATGGGHTALAFAPHVREVVATDLTPAMLAAAERFITGQGVTNVRFQEADAEALPFEPATFDIVTCRVAPHHFGDVAGFLAEVARVLRPGGLFLLVDTIAPEDPELDAFINGVEKQRDPTHTRDYTTSEWRRFCSAAGLVVRHEETWLKSIPFEDWCDRARVHPTTRAALVTQLLEASPEARATFAIRPSADGVEQLALHAVLLVAGKA